MNNNNFVIIYLKLLYLIIICFILMPFYVPEIRASDLNGEKLSGYIEIIFDMGIKRVNLSTGKIEDIIQKNIDIPVSEFDIAPNGRDRVFCLSRLENDSKLIIYSNSKNIRTIVSKNFVSNPAYSPDGNIIAYLYSEYKTNPENWVEDWYLHIIKPDGSMDRKISGIPLCRDRPSWFPDNKRIAVGTKNLNIYIIDIEKGTEQKIIDFGRAPTVSCDGQKIAYLSKNIDAITKKRMIDRKNITTKEYEETVLGKDNRKNEMRELAKLFNQYSVYLFEIATGEQKKITEELIIERPVVWSPDNKYLIYTDERWLGHDIYAIDIKTGKKVKATSERGEVMIWQAGDNSIIN